MSLLRFALGLLFAVQLGDPAAGEIYRWTDAEGRVHFTQDLSQVPPDQRAAAGRPPGADRLQIYSSGERARRARPGASRAHRIPFQRESGLMFVTAEVDDRVSVRFIVDSGASGVSLPRFVAERLGYDLGPGAQRVPITTANGVVYEPLIQLESVQLGSARVERLPAVVSESMNVGLLGGAFINNFVYQVDAASRTLVLEPNEGVRGAHSAAEWRERFQALRTGIDRLERTLRDEHFLREGRVAELEAHHERLVEELALLERAANEMGVPRSWRE